MRLNTRRPALDCGSPSPPARTFGSSFTIKESASPKSTFPASLSDFCVSLRPARLKPRAVVLDCRLPRPSFKLMTAQSNAKANPASGLFSRSGSRSPHRPPHDGLTYLNSEILLGDPDRVGIELFRRSDPVIGDKGRRGSIRDGKVVPGEKFGECVVPARFNLGSNLQKLVSPTLEIWQQFVSRQHADERTIAARVRLFQHRIFAAQIVGVELFVRQSVSNGDDAIPGRLA